MGDVGGERGDRAQGYDAWNRGDLDAFVDQFAPDATVHPLDYWTDSQIRSGREEILRLLRELREPLERDVSEAKELVAEGDYVVTDHLWHGAMKGTEDEVEMRVGLTLTFRGGKITDMSFFRTFADALEAVGLRG